jgi:hypothetical protein
VRLSIRMLDSVANVNNFSYANQVSMTEGDSPLVYFQLIDLSQDRADQGFVPAGRRYVPATGATVSVYFDHVDNARKINRAATQPFSNDPSIWAVQLQAGDPLRGTVNLIVTMTESGKVSKGILQQAIAVYPTDGMTRL